eukprot:4913964-Pyramimonas_sp.AAC.1
MAVKADSELMSVLEQVGQGQGLAAGPVRGGAEGALQLEGLAQRHGLNGPRQVPLRPEVAVHLRSRAARGPLSRAVAAARRYIYTFEIALRRGRAAGHGTLASQPKGKCPPPLLHVAPI